jgi:hypothetical protein
MKSLVSIASLALLVAAPAFAQMAEQSSTDSPPAMTESGALHQSTIVGKIIEVDAANRTVRLDDGTLLDLPASFEPTSFPMVGDQVTVTIEEEWPQKGIRSIEVVFGERSNTAPQ